MLAHPIEEADWREPRPRRDRRPNGNGTACACRSPPAAARCACSRAPATTSRRAFPEIVAAFRHLDAVLDGELLVVRDGERRALQRPAAAPQPQERHAAHDEATIRPSSASTTCSSTAARTCARCRSSSAAPASRPGTRAHQPRLDRRQRARRRSSTSTSSSAIWGGTREAGIEGLMLKRKSSPYLAGRPKGHWFKWKRAALTLDCVLMYAQRGSGKRSSYYSDYTFGVWRERRGEDGEPGTSWCRSARPTPASPTRSCIARPLRAQPHDRAVRPRARRRAEARARGGLRRHVSRRRGTSPASPCASRASTASAGTSRPPRPTRWRPCRS